MLTEKNREAVFNDVVKWIENMGKQEVGLGSMIKNCNILTDYIMELCEKAYNKGVKETTKTKK